MLAKRLAGILLRAVLSVIFAVVFYAGWLVVAIPTHKSGFGGPARKAAIWISAPILTGLGFAAGSKIFVLLTGTGKRRFWQTYKWCLVSCTIGGGIAWVFGPMLIVLGMFAAGTISILLDEAARIHREAMNNIG